MGEILYGAPVGQRLYEQLEKRVTALRERGIRPCLAMVRVGENGGSLSYERSSHRACGKLDIEARSCRLPESCTLQELVSTLHALNADPTVHGCLLLRPLPESLAEHTATDAIAPEKDVDGVTGQSLKQLFVGYGAGHCPCTAEAVMEMLDYYQIPLDGKRAVIVGRSLTVGKPLTLLLTGRNATVTLCHSHTRELPARCREADVLVVAAGSAGLVGPDYVREGQVVLDVGTSLNAAGKLCGDVRFEEVAPLVRAVSPVPGGVGAVTTAVLMRHVVAAAEAAR